MMAPDDLPAGAQLLLAVPVTWRVCVLGEADLVVDPGRSNSVPNTFERSLARVGRNRHLEDVAVRRADVRVVEDRGQPLACSLTAISAYLQPKGDRVAIRCLHAHAIPVREDV